MTVNSVLPIALTALAMIASGLVTALPASMSRMTVSRMRAADLESSATGYVYDSQRGQPASYVRYTNHGGYYDAPPAIRYVTYREPGAILQPGPTVIAAVPAYSGEVVAHPPNYAEAPKKAPLAPYFVSAGSPDEPLRTANVDAEDNDEDDESHEIHEDHDDDDDDDSEEDEDDEDEEEIHGGGEDSHSEEESSHGEKGDAGYKSRHSFNNGVKGEHHKDREEGHYSEDEGAKRSHIAAAGNYGEHDEAEKSISGESHGEKTYHKKGHKTTGYHNVYKKDEYKKDTDFYDDDHKSGHYDRHSSSDGRHSSADGGYQKGERHESGHTASQKGSEGHREKGQELSEHSGHRSAEGADTYHKNHADFATRDAAEGTKKYGYDRGHK